MMIGEVLAEAKVDVDLFDVTLASVEMVGSAKAG